MFPAHPALSRVICLDIPDEFFFCSRNWSNCFRTGFRSISDGARMSQDKDAKGARMPRVHWVPGVPRVQGARGALRTNAWHS